MVSLNKAIKSVHDELPEIQCPDLIIQSLEDQTIHPDSAEIIYNGIGNQHKEVLYWEDEDHYLPLSSARNKVGQRIKGFILTYELG